MLRFHRLLAVDNSDPVQRLHVIRSVHRTQVLQRQRVRFLPEQLVERRRPEIGVVAGIAEEGLTTDYIALERLKLGIGVVGLCDIHCSRTSCRLAQSPPPIHEIRGGGSHGPGAAVEALTACQAGSRRYDGPARTLLLAPE